MNLIIIQLFLSSGYLHTLRPKYLPYHQIVEQSGPYVALFR